MRCVRANKKVIIKGGVFLGCSVLAWCIYRKFSDNTSNAAEDESESANNQNSNNYNKITTDSAEDRKDHRSHNNENNNGIVCQDLRGPLRSDPKLGNFPDMSAAGSLHEYLMHLTAKYGPIGTFHWGTLRVAYVTSIEVIYHKTNRALQRLYTRPPELFEGFKIMIGENSIQYANKADIFWPRYRNVFVAGYGQSVLHRKIGIMTKNALCLRDKWQVELRNCNAAKSQKRPMFDAIAELFSFASKSVIYASFGENISAKLCQNIADGYLIAWKEMEDRLINGQPADEERESKFQNALSMMRNSVAEILEHNKREKEQQQQQSPEMTAATATANGEGEHVFLNHVLQNPKLYPTEQSISDDAISAITAGTHTTGNGVAWLMYYIALYPEVQRQMRNEIQQVFDGFECKSHTHSHRENDNNNGNHGGGHTDELIAELKMYDRLRYCQKVIFETLRVTAMAPWGARVNYESDMQLDDCRGHQFHIPKDMPVVIGFGCCLQDEQIWRNHTQFDPNRWNAESMNKFQKDSKLLIFGGLGKRICPGYRFFHVEALIFLSKMLPAFRFSLADETLPERMGFNHGLVTAPTSPILLNLTAITDSQTQSK